MEQEKLIALEKTIITDYGNITGMVVRQNGISQYEHYFNGYSPTSPLHIASVTKSVISALIGIAIENGQIKSIDQKILDFYPDYMIKEGEKNIQNVTIKNMLTMTAPYKYETEPYEPFFASDNWITFALDLLGGTGKIGDFVYSALIGTQILSGILVKSTGQTILDFAALHLFSPLGITVAQNVMFHSKEEQLAWYTRDKESNCWVVDPQGINTAGWGLCITPADMAKIGQLYLNGGMWEGKQIIPTAWVEQSTREQSRWGKLSYGYLWWIIDDKEHSFAALGDGGNVIFINPKKKLVVAIASLFMPEAKDRIKLIKEIIEPLFIKEGGED
jgi:CubicO group peptidase (beta-lactamase class C family)